MHKLKEEIEQSLYDKIVKVKNDLHCVLAELSTTHGILLEVDVFYQDVSTLGGEGLIIDYFPQVDFQPVKKYNKV